MKLLSTLAGAALVFIPGYAIAAPAYEVSGLHIDMPLQDAVAQAEKLGGVCAGLASQGKEGVVYVQCEFQTCDKEKPAATCDPESLVAPGPAIAAQPIIRVGMEAIEASSRLTQIVIAFEGSSEVVEQRLTENFGEPKRDGSVASERTWTTARRLHWAQGTRHLGLHTTVNLILLTIDTSDPESGSDENG